MKRNTATYIATALVFAFAIVAQASTPLNAVITIDDPEGNTGDARVRVLHASPDAPAVDVLVNDGVAFSNLAFEGVTDFASLPADTYNVKVVPTGEMGPVVIGADLPLAGGTDYTVIATDFLAMITPSILTATGGTPTEGNVWVRFFHGSPDTPAVDIALTGGDVLIPNVAFQQGSEYIEVPGGTYDLEARVAGTMTVGLALPGVTLEAGMVYTVYATGLLADVGALDNFYFLPAAARAAGFENSFWTTDVDVNNSTAGDANFQYLWLPRGTDNSMPTASDTFMLGPGETIRHADVLGAAFGVEDGTNALGALAILSDSMDIRIFSRTYNTNDAGTFGQGIAGIAADDLIPAGMKKRILFFTENDMYRSNIGVLNGTGAPLTVMWERFTSDGAMVDAASADLRPWENVQLNQVFGNEAPVEGAYIDIWTETEGGAFTAYGSVLDNMTSDPTTVLPQ